MDFGRPLGLSAPHVHAEHSVLEDVSYKIHDL